MMVIGPGPRRRRRVFAVSRSRGAPGRACPANAAPMAVAIGGVLVKAIVVGLAICVDRLPSSCCGARASSSATTTWPTAAACRTCNRSGYCVTGWLPRPACRRRVTRPRGQCTDRVRRCQGMRADALRARRATAATSRAPPARSCGGDRLWLERGVPRATCEGPGSCGAIDCELACSCDVSCASGDCGAQTCPRSPRKASAATIRSCAAPRAATAATRTPPAFACDARAVREYEYAFDPWAKSSR